MISNGTNRRTYSPVVHDAIHHSEISLRGRRPHPGLARSLLANTYPYSMAVMRYRPVTCVYFALQCKAGRTGWSTRVSCSKTAVGAITTRQNCTASASALPSTGLARWLFKLTTVCVMVRITRAITYIVEANKNHR